MRFQRVNDFLHMRSLMSVTNQSGCKMINHFEFCHIPSHHPPIMTSSVVYVILYACLHATLAADDPYFVYPDVFNDPERDAFYYDKFPDDFIWSSATSSYQIEGAWDVADKGKSIWDTFAQTPGKIANNDNGNVACDSYNK